MSKFSRDVFSWRTMLHVRLICMLIVPAFHLQPVTVARASTSAIFYVPASNTVADLIPGAARRGGDPVARSLPPHDRLFRGTPSCASSTNPKPRSKQKHPPSPQA